jgi:hypothetical protein
MKRTGQSKMMKLSMMIDAYGWHCFARSVSRSKVKVICILVAKRKNKSYKKHCSVIVDGT